MADAAAFYNLEEQTGRIARRQEKRKISSECTNVTQVIWRATSYDDQQR
jgi:hypothetical protein